MGKCAYTPSLLKKRLTIQQQALTADGQGGFEESWFDLATVWAQIEPAKGYERLQGMQLGSPVSHKVLIRYHRSLTTAKRLRYGSRLFDIKEIINVEERNAWMRLICVELPPLRPHDSILLEDGGFLLTEDGQQIGLETIDAITGENKAGLSTEDGKIITIEG